MLMAPCAPLILFLGGIGFCAYFEPDFCSVPELGTLIYRM